MDDMKYKEYTLKLEKGDKLFLYTDGIAEASNADNDMFGTGRMIDALNAVKDSNAKDIIKGVRTEVSAFVKDAEQFDDMTMLCLEYYGTGNE